MRVATLALYLANLGISASGQTSDSGVDQVLSNSFAATVKAMHANIRRNLADAAASMPVEGYGFRPAPQVRTFAQLIGHVTNANFLFCSAAKGEPSPYKQNAENLTAKDVALKALLESLAYCDSVYMDTTDTNFGGRASVAGSKPTATTRGAILIFNTTHNNEHYGNIVVYLRLKGLVPPSTARVQSGPR